MAARVVGRQMMAGTGLLNPTSAPQTGSILPSLSAYFASTKGVTNASGGRKPSVVALSKGSIRVENSSGVITPTRAECESEPRNRFSRVPSGAECDSLLSTDGTASKRFSRPPLNQSFCANYAYFVGDIASTAASVDLAHSVSMNTTPNTALQVSRFTSGLSMFTGAVCYISGTEKLRAAKKINDVAGTRIAQIYRARGAVEATMGANMVGFRAFSIASLRTTSKTIAAATQAIGIASTVTGSLTYTLLGLPLAINGVQAFKFLHQLDKCLKAGSEAEGLRAALIHLRSQIELGESDWEECRKGLPKDEKALRELLNSDIKLSSKGLERLTKEDYQQIEKDVARLYSHLDEAERNQIEVAYAKEVSRIKLVKERAVSRAVGSVALSKMIEVLRNKPEGESLTDRLDKGEGIKEAREAIGVIQGEGRKNMLIAALVVVTCIIGIAGMIMATVFTGGAPLIAGLILSVVCNVLMIGLDGSSTLDDMKGLKPNTKDRIFIVITAIVYALTIGLGTFLAAGPAARLAITLVGAVAAAIMAGFMGWTYYQESKQKEAEL